MDSGWVSGIAVANTLAILWIATRLIDCVASVIQAAIQSRRWVPEDALGLDPSLRYGIVGIVPAICHANISSDGAVRSIAGSVVL